MHIPVLLTEVIEFLNPKDNSIIVDATYGYGGHTSALLTQGATVYAFDADENVSPSTKVNNLYFQNKWFSEIAETLVNQHIKIDGLLADFGVSSMQLDNQERGFSFNSDSKLDMRMSTRLNYSAYDLINYLDEKKLSDLIFRFSGEVNSKKIAKAIVTSRILEPIYSAVQLSQIISSLNLRNQKGIHPATLTFMALRIAVNDELNQIRLLLEDLTKYLKLGSKIALIAFHSLECQVIDEFIERFSDFKLMGIISPTVAELNSNPRARSAKLYKIIYEKI